MDKLVQSLQTSDYVKSLLMNNIHIREKLPVRYVPLV